MKPACLILLSLILSSLLFFPSTVFSQSCPPGDANADCKVDGVDYVIWLNNFNTSVTGSVYGDFNNNGFVDGIDYVIWLNNYNSSGPPTGNRIIYTSDTTEFPNPERGFMRQSNIDVGASFDSSRIGKKDPNDTVDWVYFHLEKYRDPRDGPGVTVSNYQYIPLEPLGSGKGLDTVQKTFADARTKGLKLVIRFLYLGYGGIGSTSDFANAEPDAPLDVALKHIDQLAPVVNQNKDVIAAVQAGFVGYWGEWHSSKYLHPTANRKAIVDKLLTTLDKNLMVQVRYPRYVQVFYGGPISPAEAFNQSNLSRVGFHDDAAFKDEYDDGTFRSSSAGTKISNYCDGNSAGEIECWRNYYGQTSTYTPSGGEAGTHASSASTSADCPNALRELDRLNFSFLHNSYSMITLNHWVSQGCMPEIRKRLGYRLELKEATIPQSIRAGASFNPNININNVGFASMYNPRPVYLVLIGQQRYEILLPNVDPRHILSGTNYVISGNVTIPANVTPGTYKLALWLPDSSQTLKNNPVFSVRFANTGTWDSQNGTNILLPNFQIQP